MEQSVLTNTDSIIERFNGKIKQIYEKEKQHLTEENMAQIKNEIINKLNSEQILTNTNINLSNIKQIILDNYYQCNYSV